MGSGPVEGVGDEVDVGGETPTFGRRGVEHSATLLLMGVNGGEVRPRGGLGVVGTVECGCARFMLVGGSTDGVGVASWPSPPGELSVVVSGGDEFSGGGTAGGHGGRHVAAGGVVFGLAVGGHGGVEDGELVGESMVGEPERVRGRRRGVGRRGRRPGRRRSSGRRGGRVRR